MKADKDPFIALSEAELLNPDGYDPEFLRGFLRSGALRSVFSSESTAEGNLQIVRQAGCHSVELALSLGIVVSLFTGPVRRYRPDVWTELEEGFLSGGKLGGMMITEPGCGTDMLACTSACRAEGEGFVLKGMKHWAGLTGLADYWLILAKDERGGGRKRFPSLNFFVCRNDPEAFKVVQRYRTLGLRAIPYGRTEINASDEVLAPLLEGSRVRRFRQIHGILHRSRISISAITLGVCERMAKEARRHVSTRNVFGQPLADYGQVQARMAEIEAAEAIQNVLFEKACREAEKEDASDETEVDSLTANIVKTVCTDLAFAAATSASQLLGGNSYRVDQYIGRAAVDLRPFRIFEGSNDVLCDAIWTAVAKAAKTGGPSFGDVLQSVYERAGWSLPSSVASWSEYGSQDIPQGMRCLGGRVLANAFALQWCVDAGLSASACRPLSTRINRDCAVAGTRDFEAAGLLEY